MSGSNDNDLIRKSIDKSISSSASSSSSFERRKSDPDTKPSGLNPASGLIKCSRRDRPLSTDRKKVTGFAKGGGDGDESNTSPESGTPEEIDEEESDMKRWAEL